MTLSVGMQPLVVKEVYYGHLESIIILTENSFNDKKCY